MYKRYVLSSSETVTINNKRDAEFIRQYKRGILIALQQNGVLSVAQLEQCLSALDSQPV